MTSQEPSATPTPVIRRRALTQGAAWALPTVVVGGAAKAAAASQPVTCPPTPIGGGLNPSTTGGWTWSKTSGTNNAPAGMLNSTSNTFNMWVDSTAAVGTNTQTVTATSTAISVTKGCTYPITIALQTQGGYFGTDSPPTYGCTTRNVNLEVVMGATSLLKVSTQSSGGNQVVQFPTQAPSTKGGCSAGYGFGARNMQGATDTFTQVYTATATGTVQIKLIFTLWGTTNSGNNDDYRGSITIGPGCQC